MARTPQDVTDAELAVLQALWERGPANRRQSAVPNFLQRGTGSARFRCIAAQGRLAGIKVPAWPHFRPIK